MTNELDLRDYFRIVRKRLWWIVGVVLIVTVAAGLYSIYVKDPIYQASTKIIVNQTSAQVMANQPQLNSDMVNTNIRMIETYKEIIKTPAILDKVVQYYPQLQLTSEQLAEKIKVSSVNNTQVMTVGVTDLSYRKAAEIANAVSEIFRQEIPNIFNVENVSILNNAKLEPAQSPSPISPNIPLNIAIAFIVSLMLSVGVAFLLEYLDDSIKTEQDVERYLELPVLASISKVNFDENQGGMAGRPTQVKSTGELNHVSTGK
ncbi:YveK family protein [Cohnella rhizosphaerae]|uniref:Wzz/FepE/Etk N-terminal domain-containing protein n=1 Tax=Cohnella rhizosphaerae TaxID=1457232 RepID=A0A9X4QUS7_9BACL|nr:Wzz/FepE/Etk N-terminal domain-containing protein [Cohnella rhizosphaerae]MDG0811829.1 Wzz/FepE/Etk N-terminal domain-containing protein [Cohnella rhizosphaerae]